MAVETIQGPFEVTALEADGTIASGTNKYQVRAAGFARLQGTIQYSLAGDIAAGYPRVVQFGGPNGAASELITAFSPDSPGGTTFTIDVKLVLQYVRIELEA